jgi:Histidine kinase-, DNA gyrase B-, and HSP90-like ATPase
MGETRINLKHLLEDIRDTYPFPVEEVILTELVANALDSGASEIRLTVNTEQPALTVCDNGKGMTPPQLDRYHDVAATTKERGKGIGFAGLGAKLALLVAEAVITETRAGASTNATHWRLEGNARAPWALIEPAGQIAGVSGTAVTLALRDACLLANAGHVTEVLQTHFQPLLEESFRPLMEVLYPGGLRLWVNGRSVAPPKVKGVRARQRFTARGVGGKVLGLGFIGKSGRDLPDGEQGIGIATYGKVIKRGWEWLGLRPRHPQRVTGLVEVPALVDILTTNKADFLKDSGSLKKYYRYRKSIQDAVAPLLRELGEAAPERERGSRDVRPLEREVEQVLGGLIEEYPEIAPLVGRRRTRRAGEALQPEDDGLTTAALAETLHGRANHPAGPGDQGSGTTTLPARAAEAMLEANEDGDLRVALAAGKRLGPGLRIGFEDARERNDLGWLLENTIWINRAHPAYRKAASTGNESYHVVLGVVWVLLGHLDDRHSAQEFIGQFLSGWGRRPEVGR